MKRHSSSKPRSGSIEQPTYLGFGTPGCIPAPLRGYSGEPSSLKSQTCPASLSVQYPHVMSFLVFFRPLSSRVAFIPMSLPTSDTQSAAVATWGFFVNCVDHCLDAKRCPRRSWLRVATAAD